MKIDRNLKEIETLWTFLQEKAGKGTDIRDEFIAELAEAMKSQDHCPCETKCKFHGKCLECVAIHRAYNNHLPYCFRNMVNERLRALSALTEHTMTKG